MDWLLFMAMIFNGFAFGRAVSDTSWDVSPVNFIIVALALFLFIKKFLGFLLRNRKEETAVIPPLTKDQQLLTDIRDLLQKQAGKQGA